MNFDEYYTDAVMNDYGMDEPFCPNCNDQGCEYCEEEFYQEDEPDYSAYLDWE